MPTTIIKSIGSAPERDYATIQDWADDCPVNLVAVDQIWRGELYNDSEFELTEVILIEGITTDATRYIELTVAEGESFQDDPDVRTNPLKYDQTKGVGIRGTLATSALLYIDTLYSRVSRIQFKIPDGEAIDLIGSEDDGLHILQDLILDVTGPYYFVGSFGPLRGYNLLGIGHGITYGYLLGIDSELVGCSAICPSDETVGDVAYTWYSEAETERILINCNSFGFTLPCDVASFDAVNSKNNATDQASGLPGVNNVYEVSYTELTPFINSDSASLDLRAVEDTELAETGASEGSNPTDISLYPRSSTPTIGHWELTAPEPIPSTPTDGSLSLGDAVELEDGITYTLPGNSTLITPFITNGVIELSLNGQNWVEVELTSGQSFRTSAQFIRSVGGNSSVICK